MKPFYFLLVLQNLLNHVKNIVAINKNMSKRSISLMEPLAVFCLMGIVYIVGAAWHESGKDTEGR